MAEDVCGRDRQANGMTNSQDSAKAQAITSWRNVIHPTAITAPLPGQPPSSMCARGRSAGRGGPSSHLQARPRVSRRPETYKKATVFEPHGHPLAAAQPAKTDLPVPDAPIPPPGGPFNQFT